MLASPAACFATPLASTRVLHPATPSVAAGSPATPLSMPPLPAQAVPAPLAAAPAAAPMAPLVADPALAWLLAKHAMAQSDRYQEATIGDSAMVKKLRAAVAAAADDPEG